MYLETNFRDDEIISFGKETLLFLKSAFWKRRLLFVLVAKQTEQSFSETTLLKSSFLPIFLSHRPGDFFETYF